MVGCRATDAPRPGLAALAAGESSAGTGGVRSGRDGVRVHRSGCAAGGDGPGAVHAAFPVFARVFDEVCAELDSHLGPLPGRVAGGRTRTGLLDRTGFAQPALFAVEVALFRLLESWGVRPDVLVGHSDR